MPASSATVPRFADALGAFMDGEEAADAVPGAVVEIEPGFPERQPRQRIEFCAPVVPPGKHRPRNRDMALEDAGVMRRASPAVGLAHEERAGDVGGAVAILRSGIDQEHVSDIDPPVCFLG